MQGGDCVFSCQSHVVAHLLDGSELSNTARGYLANLQIEQAVYTSSESGARVDLSTAAGL